MLLVERSPTGAVRDLLALQEDGMLVQVYVFRDVRPTRRTSQSYAVF